MKGKSLIGPVGNSGTRKRERNLAAVILKGGNNEKYTGQTFHLGLLNFHRYSSRDDGRHPGLSEGVRSPSSAHRCD